MLNLHFKFDLHQNFLIDFSVQGFFNFIAYFLLGVFSFYFWHFIIAFSLVFERLFHISWILSDRFTSSNITNSLLSGRQLVSD